MATSHPKLYYWPKNPDHKATMILDSGYEENGKPTGLFYVYRLEKAYSRDELETVMGALGDADHIFDVKQMKP